MSKKEEQVTMIHHSDELPTMNISFSEANPQGNNLMNFSITCSGETIEKAAWGFEFLMALHKELTTSKEVKKK